MSKMWLFKEIIQIHWILQGQAKREEKLNDWPKTKTHFTSCFVVITMLQANQSPDNENRWHTFTSSKTWNPFVIQSHC